MLGKASQAVVRPTALGLMAQSSTYGAVIPRIYGTTKTPWLLIWAANLRQNGTSGKKGKGKKGGMPVYAENADFLLGSNPIAGVLRVWANNTGYDLNSIKYSTSILPSITISDPNFYQVIGVTINIPYDVTFNDYGGPGSDHQTGTYETPMWNTAYSGPNPTDTSGYQVWPYTFYWKPGSGPTIYIDAAGMIGPLPLGATVNIYYAQIQTGKVSPLAQLLMQFESRLGSGSEYSFAPTQQIIYPMYAGVGTPSLDLGSGQIMPSIRSETIGAYSVYPYLQGLGRLDGIYHAMGDADFVDMVEDILKMGNSQTDPAGTAPTAFSDISFGLGCSNFPGMVQKKMLSNFWGINSIAYDLPNTAGNFLFVFITRPGGAPATFAISDLAGNSWTQIFSTNTHYQGWYCTALAYPGRNVVTVSGSTGVTATDVQALEFQGLDTIDSVIVTSGSGVIASASLTASNVAGESEYMFGWAFVDAASDGFLTNQVIPLWDPLMVGVGNVGHGTVAASAVYSRLVKTPGSYTLSISINKGSPVPWIMVLFGLKNSQPVSYPKATGDILDGESTALVRQQCRANGLWGSLCMDSQKKAADWLKDLAIAGNFAYVWSGFKLKLIPLSEVSFVGNGAIYNSPTASGPVVDIPEADLIGDRNSSLISVDRNQTADRENILQIQHPSRTFAYNNIITAQPDHASIAKYGPRKASPIALACIQDAAVARRILLPMIRRKNYVTPISYKWTMQARHKLVEAMDLVTINDSKLGISHLPVRVTSIEESEKYELSCTAEPFYYGASAPVDRAITENAGSVTDLGVVPANVNTPIFLEPPLRMTSNRDELWMVVSDADPAYGGCIVYVSVDGGTSYVSLGRISGNAVTGNTTATWPQALDPDTTNDLPLDLTESLGVLSNYSTQQQDAFTYPCFVNGNGGSAAFPFELMTYAVALLTSANHYTLKATGGGGNRLRRAVFGTWVSPTTQNTGPSHSSPSRFALIDPTGKGNLKVLVDPTWTGKTLYFKFVQFNTFLTGFALLANVTAYSYVVKGTGTGGGVGGGGGGNGNSSYTLNPAKPLSNPNSTHIALAQVVATFSPSGTMTNYNARSFTISDPGGTPQIYYVTVYDPSLVGDTGSGTNLTSFCATTPAGAHVGEAGYIYMGNITAVHGGGGVGGGGGSAGGSLLISTVGITVDGGAAPPTTGSKGFIQVPYAGTLVGWTIISDIAGSVVVTVKKCADGAFPTTVAISGATPPTLSTAQKNETADLSAWSTTAIAIGDIFEFTIASISTLNRFTVELKIART